MGDKPVVTYAGDEKLFKTLEPLLLEGLPLEPVEWKRSYGRGPKAVSVEARFEAFDPDGLPREGEEPRLLGQPFLHVYWTDCTDLEVYRSRVREDIIGWLAQLKAANVYDWMLVAVEGPEPRRSNKAKLLPRATVFDRMRADFPSKTSDRCCQLVEPQRSADSVQSLLGRLRQLLLHACGRHLGRFEDLVRQQRERRTLPQWSFLGFFFLQEELAFVLEMLGLYEEALVQYDELDALFSQFVINSASGADAPEWLTQLASVGCESWAGLRLSGRSLDRPALREGRGSLLQLRTYLFSRQCLLLLRLGQPWEMAARCLPFLQHTVHELRSLEVSVCPGAVSCWVLLSCLEVLGVCQRLSDTSHTEESSLHTVGLWAYARLKLKELGELCGLMPPQSSDSEQLLLVVSLLSGMGEEDAPKQDGQSPHSQVREALSSRESFLKHYLDLSERTMITCKHLGRIRSARLVGKDMAELYIRLGQPERAVPFLGDLLRTQADEGWTQLALATQQELCRCYLELKQWGKFLKASTQLACHPGLATDERLAHLADACQHMGTLGDSGDGPMTLEAEGIVRLNRVAVPGDGQWTAGSELTVGLQLTSHLPAPVRCRKISLLLEREDASQPVYPSMQAPTAPPLRQGGRGDWVPSVHMAVAQGVARKEGGTAVGLICTNLQELLPGPRHTPTSRFSRSPLEGATVDLVLLGAELVPGPNELFITHKVEQPGCYRPRQLFVDWEQLSLAELDLGRQPCLHVTREGPKLALHFPQGKYARHYAAWTRLLAGVVQRAQLVVTAGSHPLAPEDAVTLKTSRGLQLKAGPRVPGAEEFSVEGRARVGPLGPKEGASVELELLAQVSRDALSHQVALSLLGTEAQAQLHFLPPFECSHRLHTCHHRWKYVQVSLQGLTSQCFTVGNASLVATGNQQVFLKPLNSTSQLLRVSPEQTAQFLWEMMDGDGEAVHFSFSLLYSLAGQGGQRVENTYTHNFRMDGYQTLYAVKVRVDPCTGSEFCRAECPCSLEVCISRLGTCAHAAALMYELLPDPNVWAVCGRTAGVVHMGEEREHAVTLEVKPLVRGFLPLPTVRLSKYIPSATPKGVPVAAAAEGGTQSTAKLEPFLPGQVYNWSRAMQVHVLAPSTLSSEAA
ncbi:unnamed protein product [Ixodes hexagonus]